MSKHKNSPNSKAIVENKLKEVGLSLAEVEKWLKTGVIEEANEEKEDTQGYFSFIKEAAQNRTPSNNCNTTGSCKKENSKSSNFEEFFNYLKGSEQENYEHELCEVSFLPGSNTEETAVYVGEYRLKGVVRSSLEYDPEVFLPVLHLEILNPRII